ncbi:b7d622d8-8007-4534-b3e5-c6149ae1fc57 [Sclerotinia trifoliorum]|uniref:B7d622d8-8007-4534-b3e5-c6149ae1fc57 n=1 Tax=Sclerotinia trifoliorum TaxID=28548 RepID=A0A8H2W4P8_9HELO|nr:b7d622d8-8007-4534-b3e5-c6149ae1fc57 [Sclerotinia trifoliorum]
MAHQRVTSTLDGVKEPHSVSLKVLRLSRPSLSIQHPLPTHSPSPPPNLSLPAPSASLAYPSPAPSNFILSPLLTLPPAFGSAYVGETFSCTLCANNELPPLPQLAQTHTSPDIAASSDTTKIISNITLTAEMKIPSTPNPISLPLSGPSQSPPTSTSGEESPETPISQTSLQKVLHFDLKEEGAHVLAVTVTYTESSPSSPPRTRTFRKLYQFICKGCLVVRTKTGTLPSLKSTSSNRSSTSIPPTSPSKETKRKRSYALEAQLENITEDNPITLTLVHLTTTEGFNATSLNWEVVVSDSEKENGGGEAELERPVLAPGDIRQVCFLVEEKDPEGEKEGIQGENEKESEIVDGRLIFGVLSIGWRGAMGNKGFLSTGNLGIRVS